MADMGFLPAVTSLLDRVPAGGQRLLFSATLDSQVDTLVRRYLTDPVRHQLAPATSAASRMDHQIRSVRASDKVAVAAELAGRPGRTLVFVRTKHRAARLAQQLQHAGIRAGALHGNLAQPARTRALAAFAAGTVPVLVATDIAARGIHVEGIDLVVHFDPPAEPKAYLHRSGRTARAGAAGTMVTLVLPEQASEVATLHRRVQVTTSPLPQERSPHRPQAGSALVAAVDVVWSRPASATTTDTKEGRAMSGPGELTWDEAMDRGRAALNDSERLYDDINASEGRSNLDIEKHLRRSEVRAAQAQAWLISPGSSAAKASGTATEEPDLGAQGRPPPQHHQRAGAV
jgi:superfamily II DNA/RNA helicase